MVAATSLQSVGIQAQVVRKCESPTAALITGLVVDDSTGKPLGGASVQLLIAGCYVSADTDGRFVFHGVRPGTERVGAAHPGYRRMAAVQLTIMQSDTIAIELRLKPGGPIEDCRVDAACARLLMEADAESLNDEERFRLATLATTIAIAWKDVAGGTPWHACIDESSVAVIAMLTARYGPIVPRAECGVTLEEETPLRVRVRHLAGRTPAFFVQVDSVTNFSADRRTANLDYLAGPLWGQEWRCSFDRTARGWSAVECVLVSES
jgi:hypothetical protein